MNTITITQEDNTAAEESRKGYEEGFQWDVCQFCPVSQAFNRTQVPFAWLVNRDGARPKGALSYWFRFGQTLKNAISEYDKHKTPIIGTFLVFDRRDLRS